MTPAQTIALIITFSIVGVVLPIVALVTVHISGDRIPGRRRR